MCCTAELAFEAPLLLLRPTVQLISPAFQDQLRQNQKYVYTRIIRLVLCINKNRFAVTCGASTAKHDSAMKEIALKSKRYYNDYVHYLDLP